LVGDRGAGGGGSIPEITDVADLAVEIGGALIAVLDITDRSTGAVGKIVAGLADLADIVLQAIVAASQVTGHTRSRKHACAIH